MGLGVPEGMLGPTCPLLPRQVSLCGSGVPHDRPLERHSLWGSASTTPGSARIFYLMASPGVLYFVFMLFCFVYFIPGRMKLHEGQVAIPRGIN